MKYVIQGLIVISAMAAAVYLITQGKDGWGWFIFIAIAAMCA